MRGDTRLTVTLAITEETVKLGREHRFLIDDPNSPKMMAYALSKPLKLGGGYNGEGVYRFVLQEVNFTEFDNQELRIADYYRYFPTIGLAPETSASNNKVDPRHNKTDNGTEVLL